MGGLSSWRPDCSSLKCALPRIRKVYLVSDQIRRAPGLASLFLCLLGMGQCAYPAPHQWGAQQPPSISLPRPLPFLAGPPVVGVEGAPEGCSALLLGWEGSGVLRGPSSLAQG